MRFQFKKFQRNDYARTALHDGAVVGHDTGGGKGLALFVVPALKTGFERGPTVRALKPLAPVLIVAPGDLHDQVRNDGAEKLRARATVLDSQERFYQLSTINPSTGKRELPPGYYITSYTQLASNGTEEFPPFVNTEHVMKLLHLKESDAAEYHGDRESIFKAQYARLNATPDLSLDELTDAHRRARSEYFHNSAIKDAVDDAFAKLKMLHGKRRNATYAQLDAGQQAWIREQMARNLYLQSRAAIGESKWYSPAGVDRKIKCVYSPTLADLCQDTFAAVVVDEGVKMKGEDTIVGLGIRQMNPAYRYVLTATPIKNRLPDVFRLAWWAAGGKPKAHARFPYPDDSAARDEFSDEFLVIERNLSAEEKSETSRRFVKRTPQVCNVHRLWKMFAPVILRRRKADFGEDIVAKVRHVVRVPLGKNQMEVYKFHLEGEYKDRNGMPAIGPQLQALRIAAANPASALLKSTGPDGRSLHPVKPNQPPPPSMYASRYTYIPKLHSTLKLIDQILARGEQVVVFSAFHDSLDALSARLQAAGVKHAVLDGRTSQKKRGRIAGLFKSGPRKAHDRRPGEAPSEYPVLLAGVECMAEGHSFHRCNNVILMCYSWAYDKFEQAINRVHRLNSLWDVNVYPVICEGSIDRKLEALIQEKGEAAELVLDGKLALEQTSEVNMAELLHVARMEFAENGKGRFQVVDEAELEKEWPALQRSLSVAAKRWVLTPNPAVEPEIMSKITIKNPGNPLLIRAKQRQRAFNDLPLFAMAS
jgi:SNF2 family DNA or RNA helicase